MYSTFARNTETFPRGQLYDQLGLAVRFYANSTEVGPTDTTMTLLQTTQTGRRVNVLYNYLIKLFQHNSMAVNEQTPTTFDVLLTVLLSIFISVINQLDAQNLVLQ